MGMLGIECSTKRASIAFVEDTGTCCELYTEGFPHSRRFPQLLKTLEERVPGLFQRINGIAVGVGPGSFTGIRLALSIAQGIAFGLGVNTLIPVTSSEALCAACMDAACCHTKNMRSVITIIDARRSEYYVREYSIAEKVFLSDDVLISCDTLFSWIQHRKNTFFFGPDVLLLRKQAASICHQQSFSRIDEKDTYPVAAWVARCGYKKLIDGYSAEKVIEPLYLHRM